MNGNDTYDLLSDWNPTPAPAPTPAPNATVGPDNANSDSTRNLTFQFHSRFDDSTSSSSSSFSNQDDDDHTPTDFDLESTNKRLDYMLQFLDRKLSIPSPPSLSPTPSNNANRHSESLPEFVGLGGGRGIFKVPVRAAVHPGRPPSLELRPHPLRETQTGRHLKTLVVAGTQLWAGGERNIRVWDLTKDLYARASHPNEIGTAPFVESVDGVSPTLCMVADDGSGVVWTGHRDGRIRCWRSTSSYSSSSCFSDGFRQALSWQAHRAPVLSIVISSYGDLWSGSEGGIIKIWQWEAIETSISVFSTPEDRHLAASSVERAYIDPRNQGPPNAFSNSFTADVKHLLSDNTSGRVWSASYLLFALWDARTKELLKVFNVDGQVESRIELSTVQDLSLESISGSRKEKNQTPVGFLQRSRNVIMGAADAVRRVATKGAFGEDSQRTEALIVTLDGMIWTGCSSGLLIQWDGNGNRLQDLSFHSSAVCCLCTFGLRIWVGYASGTIQVVDLEGNLLGTWIAHGSPIVKLAVGTGYVFSLASHGGIRGWAVTSPGPVDRMLCTELACKDFLYTRIENIRILAGTWNVAQGRASPDSLISWLGTVASDVSMVVVGLQEVEMGAGFLAMSAARETVGLEEGSSVGQWWLDVIGNTLDEGSTFERIGSRQLAGMLIAVWVRDHLKPHAGDVDAAAVPCGFGRAIGNKGAVGLRLRVFNQAMCFINCHFAAHVEAVARRNADFNHVYRSMTFSRPSGLFNAVAVGTSTTVQMLRAANAVGGPSVDVMPELSEADMIIFLGDFNYRLDGISYDEARDFVSQRCFDWLREKDQLRAEMEAGNVFQGMREAAIRFPPTYKFERHQAGLAGYDSGEKKRIPAWCDRILYRDSCPLPKAECSLECPIVASVSQYDACMDVTDSDHKPVRCIFTVDIARVDESVRREEFGEAVSSSENINPLLKQLTKIPETIVSTNNLILQNQDVSILRITNKCKESKALFSIVCEGVAVIKVDGQAIDHCPRGSFGFPRWLEVDPLAGVITPDQTVEVSVHHEKFHTQEEFVDGIPQNSWCEDNRDKEAILVVRISGSYMTQMRNHRVRVRHCFSAKTEKMHQSPLNPVRSQANLLHRSDLQRLSDSYDMVDKLRTLQSP